jgi:hypothetical protein
MRKRPKGTIELVGGPRCGEMTRNGSRLGQFAVSSAATRRMVAAFRVPTRILPLLWKEESSRVDIGCFRSWGAGGWGPYGALSTWTWAHPRLSN